MQKNDLKAAADREMKAALQRVSDAGGPQIPETGSGSIAPLKTRLQHAVANMQEGLIERDTEVRGWCYRYKRTQQLRQELLVCYCLYMSNMMPVDMYCFLHVTNISCHVTTMVEP